MQCSEMTKCMFIPYVILRNRKFPIIDIKAGTKTSLTFHCDRCYFEGDVCTCCL